MSKQNLQIFTLIKMRNIMSLVMKVVQRANMVEMELFIIVLHAIEIKFLKQMYKVPQIVFQNALIYTIIMNTININAQKKMNVQQNIVYILKKRRNVPMIAKKKKSINIIIIASA